MTKRTAICNKCRKHTEHEETLFGDYLERECTECGLKLNFSRRKK